VVPNEGSVFAGGEVLTEAHDWTCTQYALMAKLCGHT